MANGDDGDQSQIYAGAEPLDADVSGYVAQALPSLYGYVDDVHRECAGVDGFVPGADAKG